MKRVLITNKGNEIEISSDEQDVISHFDNPTSYTTIILDQINQDRMYDEYFKNLKNGTIIDCGANVGLFSLYAQDGNTVYSIEPTPSHFNILSKITANYPNIKRFQQALSSRDMEVSFYCCDFNTTMNSTTNKYGKEIKVDGVRLDSFIKKNKIKKVDFVKIDIEGSEIDAITPEIVNAVKDKIACWFIEVHHTDGMDYESAREYFKKLFADCGIEMMNYRNDALVSKINASSSES